MSNSLKEAFVRQADEILARHPDLQHRWENGLGCQTLIFPALSDSGFDVVASLGKNEITVFAKSAHSHFDATTADDTNAIAAESLGLIRDLLSPAMRVREFYASGWAYRWMIEIHTADGWKAKECTTLIFWNYFGRRSQKVFQNTTLPSRP